MTARAPQPRDWHLLTCEFPPLVGGVADHSRVIAQRAAALGWRVHVHGPAGIGALSGVIVHDTLGTFSPADLARAGRLIEASAEPRRVVVQWVPHGYGRRGMNVSVSRWIGRLARAGIEVDVIVHEPFVDVSLRTAAQPLRAAVQRLMTRTVIRGARRVLLSIPAWESRLDGRWMRPRGGRTAVLPVTGTVPLTVAPAEVLRTRRRLLGTARVLIGYFGAGGVYAEQAMTAALGHLPRGTRPALVCIGRGSERAADALRRSGVDLRHLHATGQIEPRALSVHLQACDLLLQPYEDGVSGRRTTTISALEHGVPVATTIGRLSEPFWHPCVAIAPAPAHSPALLAQAVTALLEPVRAAAARRHARRLYAERFAPEAALAPLFDE